MARARTIIETENGSGTLENSADIADVPALMRRLHKEDRGSIWILLMMFYIWVILASIGFTWNTALVTSRQVQTQAIADAVSYNAAVTKARAMNLVVAGNIANLQHVSANILTMAILPFFFHAFIEFPSKIIAYLLNFDFINAGRALAESTRFFTYEWRWLVRGVIAGFLLWIDYIIEVSTGKPRHAISRRIADIHQFQHDAIKMPQRVIPDMVKSYQDFYGVEIQYGDDVSKSSRTQYSTDHISVQSLPVVTFDRLDFDDIERLDAFLPVFSRIFLDHQGLYDYFKRHYRATKVAEVWRVWAMGMSLLALSKLHYFYILPDGLPLLEHTPSSGTMSYHNDIYDRNAMSFDDLLSNDAFLNHTMTVAVTQRNIGNLPSVMRRGNVSSPASGHYRRRSSGYLWNGMFDSRTGAGTNFDDSVMAVSSAEFFNPTLNRAAAIPIPIPGISEIPLPYRMWSTWGWNWQARYYEVHPNFLGASIGGNNSPRGYHIDMQQYNTRAGYHMFFPSDNQQMNGDLRMLIRH